MPTSQRTESTLRISFSLSKFICRPQADDITARGGTDDRRTLEMPILQRELQIGAWTINHIAGISATSGKILIHGVTGNDVRPQLTGESVVDSESSIEFQPSRDSFLQLDPAPHIV